MRPPVANKEGTPSPPVSEAVLERARAAVREYYSRCFWFRHPDAAQVQTEEEVRLVIRHLREYGDHKAWRVAQELCKCL
jgi:hypothetical protein